MSQSCLFRHDVAPEPVPFMTALRREEGVAKVDMPYGSGPCRPVTRYAGSHLARLMPRTAVGYPLALPVAW
ncbi:hypothetical protein OOK31_20010 [Streptomyces sp. NBC_00249]|uniref:hypothetical protein n=1 Tax=Streptomyces sp. NBC_00249 TaxID=2975690 RepID=UPI0022575D84|nr:hypothetical protein [Streptomyces sp. NBC_00249]MCX5196154.1 hypothetical protein [Streptomyces sp. NBC_00249]